MGKFIYEFEDYDANSGILYETDSLMKVSIHSSGEECILSANKEGLMALAKSLVKLAQENVPSGSHFHLDYPIFMEEDSKDLIIEKIA